jgi:hypothetical protein
MPVVGGVKRADDGQGVVKRIEPFHLRRLEPVARLSPRQHRVAGVHQPVAVILARRDAQGAAAVPAHGLAGLGLDPLV